MPSHGSINIFSKTGFLLILSIQLVVLITTGINNKTIKKICKKLTINIFSFSAWLNFSRI